MPTKKKIWLFETERLSVRRFTSTDDQAFFRINGNPEVVRYIRPAKTKEESDLFLQENINLYRNGSTVGRFAVFEKGTEDFAGTFSFLYLSGQEEQHIGYAMVPEAWGKGYATELVCKGIIHFFEQTTKTVLFAITSSANHASQRVLLKSGMQNRGQVFEHGEMLDLFSITREEWLSAYIPAQ